MASRATRIGTHGFGRMHGHRSAHAQVVGDDDSVEVHSWYDNEWGIGNRMLDLANFAAQRG